MSENEMSDEEFIALATSSASLDRSPKENWVENNGGLPPYIRKIARAIHQKRGIPLSRAIPMAIGKIKDWAAGGDDVTAKTRAKAAAALAKWTALKAKAGAKRVALSDTSVTISNVHPAKEYLLDQSYEYARGGDGRIIEYYDDSVVVEKYDPLTDVRTLESLEYVEFDGKGEYEVDYLFSDPTLLEEDLVGEDDLTEEEQAALQAFLEDQE